MSENGEWRYTKATNNNPNLADKTVDSAVMFTDLCGSSEISLHLGLLTVM